MKRIRIINGRVVDPSQNLDEIMDIEIEDGVITKIEPRSEATCCVGGESLLNNVNGEEKYSTTGVTVCEHDDGVTYVDASGKCVVPGFIDLHVHFRDPGLTYKETVETGAAAAINGGFTTVFAMPNTKPVADNIDVIKDVEERGRRTGIRVFQVGALTKGMKGEELVDVEAMIDGGCKAFSEDGKSVMNSSLLRKAMRVTSRKDIPIFSHCEDIDLVEGGVMNEDENAKRLGLKGISNAVEDIITARDIFLAKETNARLHLCHCSTFDSVRMVEMAKKDGVKVSAEVCPHHFTLTSDDIESDDGNYKMNPPLRTKKDKDMLIDGLEKGIMEVISTDHAPHSKEEKAKSMKEAPFGIVGLETAFCLGYTELVETGKLTFSQLIERMSTNPARIAGIDGGTLKTGSRADLAIIDINKEYEIDPEKFKSKGRNTPFARRKVKGMVQLTIGEGRILQSQF